MTSKPIDASQRIAARAVGFAFPFAMAVVIFGNFCIAGLVESADTGGRAA